MSTKQQTPPTPQYGRGRGRPRTYTQHVHSELHLTEPVLRAIEADTPPGMRRWRINRLLRTHPDLMPFIGKHKRGTTTRSQTCRPRGQRPAESVRVQVVIDRDLMDALDALPNAKGSRPERIEHLLSTHPEVTQALQES
jgi:hypothetical protein